jgi:DNA-binding beta-propeller fold protein YncE
VAVTSTHCSRIAIFAIVALLATPASPETASPIIAKIVVPGAPLAAFDIGWVDPTSERYYLADRSNKGIDIIDAKTNAFIGRIDGFVGPSTSNDTAGPNGILTVPKLKQIWAGNGDSTVKIVDIAAQPPKIIASISTGGTKRADEMGYGEEANAILVANDAEEPPFATLISTEGDHKILGKINFPNATNGLEQSVWDSVSRHFYLAVPELDHDKAKGAIAEIDPKTASLVKLIPVSQCQPAGLAFGPGQQLLVGCSQDGVEAGFAPEAMVLDVKSGEILKTITEVGGSDQVWYNPGDSRYYLAARGMPGGPVLGVIDAKTNSWVANLPTAKNAHSVSASAASNHVFVPLTPNPECQQGCIAVYAGESIKKTK